MSRPNRILYLQSPKIVGSGGDVVMRRNLRFLSAWIGRENIRAITYPFGVLHRRFWQALAFFRPDLVFLDNSYMPIPSWLYRRYRTWVFFHNVECDYTAASGADESEAARIVRQERMAVAGAEKIIAISADDSARLKEVYGRAADHVLPVSREDCFAAPDAADPDEQPYLLFVGCDFFGNTEGLFRFIEEGLDSTGLPLKVVGSGMDKYAGRYPDKNVTFVGYVPDLGAAYAGALAVVSPILSGAGMKTKIVEALMYGKRIFGTDAAFTGYGDIERYAEAYRCRDVADMANRIRSVLGSDIARLPRQSPRSREAFLTRYDDRVLLNRFLEEVCHD